MSPMGNGVGGILPEDGGGVLLPQRPQLVEVVLLLHFLRLDSNA